MSTTDNLNNDAENPLKENPQGEAPFEQGKKPGDVLDIEHEEISSQVKIFANAKEDAKKIFAALFPNSDYKKHLKALQKKYGGIEINSADDIEQYKLVKKGISEVRPFRTSVVKKTEDILYEAKKYIKDVNKMKDEFVSEVGNVENPLKEKKEKFDKLVIDRENEEKDRIAQKKNERLGLLSKNGMTFDGNFWSINDISVGVLEIEKYDDEVFETLLGKVVAQNKINLEKEAEEKENQRLADLKNKEKEEKERLQQDRFNKIKFHLAFIREDVSKCAEWSQEKFNQVYNDAVEAKKLQDERDEEIRIQLRELRIAQLESLGIKVTSEHDKLINESSREDWNVIMDGYKKAKKDKEEQEVADKRERDILSVNAKPFEALGFRHNYNTGCWEITINKDWDKGAYYHTITKDEMLSPKEGLIQAMTEMINGWNQEIEDKKEEKRLDGVFASRRIQLLNLGFTITPSGSFQIKYNEAESESVIQSVVRTETDEQFNAYILGVKTKIEKENEIKRQSQIDDTQKYNEWIDKLLAIEAPVVSDDLLNKSISSIKSALIKR